MGAAWLLAVALLVPACTSDESAARARFDDAMEFVEEDRLEEAVAALDAVAAEYPRTEHGARAADAARLYRGLTGAVERFPAKLARDRVIAVAREIERYRARHGRAPGAIDAVIRPGSDIGIDPWGEPLRYRALGGGRSYVLGTYGADGAVGGRDASADVLVRGGAFVERAPEIEP